jgi:ATP-dependent Clp protease ATP-binding subunit ClpA
MEPQVRQALDQAREFARNEKHASLEPAHLAHVLFVDGQNTVGQRTVVATAVADLPSLQSGLTELVKACPGDASSDDTCQPSSGYIDLLAHAQRQQSNAASKALRIDHLLFAMPEEPRIREVFKRSGLTTSDLHRFVPRVLTAPGMSNGLPRQNTAAATETVTAESKVLSEFGVELVAQAAAGTMDPVVGRDPEIERVIEVLSRRTKNNPCLIGEPGVGKTAVVEGIAQMIANGQINTLAGCRLVATTIIPDFPGSRHIFPASLDGPPP